MANIKIYALDEYRPSQAAELGIADMLLQSKLRAVGLLNLRALAKSKPAEVPPSPRPLRN